MRKKTFIPISALMAALLLALVAAMTPFVAEHSPVYAQTATTSSLSNLTLSVGELDMPFTWDDYEYETRVSDRTSSIRVTATPNILGSQVRVYTGTDAETQGGSGMDIDPEQATLSGNTVLLPAGTTTYIGIEVTELDDGTTDPITSVYQVEVERISSGASNDATLSAFSLNVATVPPAFDPAVTSYTALVPTGTMSVTVTVTANDTASDPPPTVDLASDKDSTIGVDNVVELSVGVNVITAKVTAANLETIKTYTFRVTKAAANASDDARLRSLSLSGITLSETFDLDKSVNEQLSPGAVEYTANVPYRVTQTTVAHAVNQSGAKATVTVPGDFNPLARGHQVFLGVGDNTIRIVVTAENAAATRNYVVTVTRAAANASDDATLSAFNLGPTITVSPGFDPAVTSYTALVANTAPPVTVIATITTGTDAAVDLASDKDSTIGDDSDKVVELSVGVNVITAKVTAADFETTKTYTLRVTKAAANASDDARLSALMVGGESVSVSGFTSGVGDDAADYTTGVTNRVSSIAISATPNHSGATVAIETGGALTDANTNWVVDADGVVNLSVGSNNILIEVTAENGSTSNYFLVINRALALASDDATLSAFNLGDTITVSPDFDPDVTSYTALVPNNITGEVTVTATTTDTNSDPPPAVDLASDKDSTIGSNNVVDLSAGVNVITAKVTAADFETTKTYTLTVTFAAANASDDTKLSALMVGGESVDVSDFIANNTGDDVVDYSTGVANGVNSIAISATPNHSGATVAIKTGVTIGADPVGTVDADGMVDLVIGEDGVNNILIEVTAENGITVSDYFLVITRALANASSNAKLESLTLSSITISPVFSDDIVMYSADIPDNIAATTITATGASVDAGRIGADAATSVVVTSDRDDDIGMNAGATANIAEHTIILSPGANVITIVVTAADYETMETYTVRVTRGVSNDATLSSLSLMDSDGMAIDLMDMDGMTVDFASDTMMYYADVDAGVDMINVMATATDSDATVSGDGAVSLDVGENTITVTVTAEDGTTTMTYTVMVTREAVPVGGDLLDIYDTNPENGIIDTAELREAILHFIAGDIDTAQMREVIILYIKG